MKRSLQAVVPMMLIAATSLAAQARPAAAPAQAPAAGGRTIRVEMKQVGNRYLFAPQNFSVKVGDVVEFVNVSGFPHNVQFEPAGIPAGAADVLNRNMGQRMGPLMGPMMTQPNAVYRVSFAGAPVGAYAYFCLPHKAMGMTGTITVAAR